MSAIDRLDKIEARLVDLDPSPWTTRLAPPSQHLYVMGPRSSVADVGIAEEDPAVLAHAAFIAAARQDVPDLVAALRAVLALVGPMTGENSGAQYVAVVRAAITAALGGAA